MLKKILILLSVIMLHSFSSWAYQSKTWISWNEDTKTSLLLVSYKEQGRWFLDLYRVPKSQLQERLWQKTFFHKKNIEKYIQTMRLQETKLFSLYDNNSLSLFNTFVPTEVSQPIWEVKESWSWEWEKTYSRWIENKVHADFFMNYNISTDCADIIIALRWIFARIHGLPAANTLTGTKVLFSQDSMKKSWRHLSQHKNWWQDQLFMTALNYIMTNTYTHSLWNDSYPIAINPDSFLPGSWFLSKHENTGHTQIISSIDRSQPHFKITLLSSTLPKKVRYLDELDFIQENQPDPKKSGFLLMRWPKKTKKRTWTLTPRKEMNHYSKEQYSTDFTSGFPSFDSALLKKIGSATLSPLRRFNRLSENIYESMFTRRAIVKEGYSECVTKERNCRKGTLNWENWSTPSRDSKIKTRINSLIKLYESHKGQGDFQQAWEDFISWPFNITTRNKEYIIKMEDIIKSFLQGHISHDPRNPIEQRWNLSTLD